MAIAAEDKPMPFARSRGKRPLGFSQQRGSAASFCGSFQSVSAANLTQAHIQGLNEWAGGKLTVDQILNKETLTVKVRWGLERWSEERRGFHPGVRFLRRPGHGERERPSVFFHGSILNSYEQSLV